MENLNKLSFKTYKINEKSIYINVQDIPQQYDSLEYSKLYLFKVVYIAKYQKDDTFIMYLSPLESSNLPIVKAYLPFEYIRVNKLIPNYDYIRELTDNEQFIIKERLFRKISYINMLSRTKARYDCYILVNGYISNKYKDDNAMTTIEKGIAEFHPITKPKKLLRDRGYTTNCYVSDKWKKINKVLNTYNNVKTEFEEPKFKPIPDNFFVD